MIKVEMELNLSILVWSTFSFSYQSDLILYLTEFRKTCILSRKIISQENFYNNLERLIIVFE